MCMREDNFLLLYPSLGTTHGLREHQTPFLEQIASVCFSVQGLSSLGSMAENDWIMRTKTYAASVMANCSGEFRGHCQPFGFNLGKRQMRPDLRPKQILGPPLKGRKPHPGLSPSHRSGLNSSTSGPKMSSRR